ncbi:MAG: winged helix-turn-helix transcriptional regulator [Spirochaetales bacterium]|nr:winged helix-turn-helix transcriptional regulator [Spirochaetales bacterium]
MVKTRIPNPQAINQQAEVFQALSSPARLVVLQALRWGEYSVNELVDILADLQCACSAERTNISKHLSVLRQLGLVEVREEGQKRLYRLGQSKLVESLLADDLWGWQNEPRPPESNCCRV